MLITSRPKSRILWSKHQETLIESLTSQPIVIVIRIAKNDLENISIRKQISLINKLHLYGIRNIEIAWSSHKNWILFVKEIKSQFERFSFGAASVTEITALESIKELDFNYAMSPCWDLELQKEAKRLGQLVVPGVSSASDIEIAINFGFKIIKLFPASKLGVEYLHTIEANLKPLPFIIAAGGMRVQDLNHWLKKGYNAIALGKELIKDNKIDPLLQLWLNEKERNLPKKIQSKK